MKVSNYNIIKEYQDKILVYNSFTKANLLLEKGQNTDAFKEIKAFNKLDDDTKKILIENGFIIDDERDEYSEIKYIFEQKFFDTSFFNIGLVPSLACNFKCPYCCEKDFKCGKENIKRYFIGLREYAKKNFHLHKIVQISLFGGEPLLYAKECIEFLDWVKKDSKKKEYQYFCSITTNGSLLTDEILVKLLNHNLYSLQITIDSDKENHDSMRIFKTGQKSFDLLIDIINKTIPKTIKYKKFKFILRINLNNTNIDKVKQTLECIDKKNRKYTHLLIRAIYNTHAYKEKNTNSVNELQEYFDLGKKMGFNVLQEKYSYQTCEACADRKFFYLMPDLSIWKCINDIGFEKAKIGKIDEHGNTELIPENVINWYKNVHQHFLMKNV